MIYINYMYHGSNNVWSRVLKDFWELIDFKEIFGPFVTIMKKEYL